MLKAIKRHPLLSLLILAMILRLPAVFVSKGFMAHDDHFETVRIAYDGIQDGLLKEDNLMIWDRMMYLIRLLHALLSLLTIYYGYRYIHEITGDRRYAVWGGLILGAHFLMPYLAVRNLIEQVAADLLVPSLYYTWSGLERGRARPLVVAGLLAGLSWMIRFPLALAVIPIPVVIWYRYRSVRPVLYYIGGIAVIMLFSGTLDIPFLGGFGRSTINILRSFLNGEPTLPQPFWTYMALIFGILIPPFSFFLLLPVFRRASLRLQPVMISAILSFFIIHSLIANKQERFMIPIFPLLIMVGMVGLYIWFRDGRVSDRWRRLFRYSALMAGIVSILLLPVFTLNYAHRGMVEPFVYLSRQNDTQTLLIERVERFRFIGLSYAGYNRPDTIVINSWPELDSLAAARSGLNKINYFLIYTDDDPAAHADSLARVFGPLERVFHSPPSTVDALLNFLNPRHNHTNEAWIYYRRIPPPETGEDG